MSSAKTWRNYAREMLIYKVDLDKGKQANEVRSWITKKYLISWSVVN